MKKIYILIVMLTQLFLVESSYAQYCGAATSNVAITPTTTNQTSAIYTSGRRAFNFAATAGCTYYFETCGLATQDTYLRLYSTGTGGTVLATGDDNCGTQSAITWTCGTSGTYSILLTRYSCNTLSASNTRLRYRINSCASAGAPCTNATAFGTLAAPTVPGAQTISTCTFQSEYNTITGIVAGQSYTIGSSCGGYISVRRDTPGGTVVGHGAAPYTFTAPTSGTYYIHYNTNSSCGTASTCCTTTITCNSCAAAYDPCASIPTISGCGTSATANMTGAGAGWSVTSCGYATPGQERLFSFTAPTTGTYTLNVSAITGGFVDFFWKPASGGCNATGWNCIDDIVGAGTYNAIVPMTFTAGTTYYILLDPEGTGTYSATFNMVCPVPATYDPCASIPTISGCGTSATANMTGAGAGWSVTSCGYATPGQERLFSFTAPTTGTYTLNVSAITGGFVDFFWKPASGGCNATGWNCIDDIFGAGTYNAIVPMTFTAGTTYYILLDPEGTGTYSATFNMVCPVAGPANDLVCNAASITCGGTVSGTTVGSGNAGTGENQTCGTGQTMGGVWYVVPGNGQIMTASLCGTVWDSKISVFSGPNCSTLTCVGGNDDAGPACATTSASYSWTSVVGQNYYILVHGYSSTSAFDITLSCVNPAPADPTSISVAETSGLSNNDGTICSGASVTLTAVGGVGTVYWFTGSCATTGQINTGNSITVSPTSTTTYFARNFNGGQWSAGCASTTVTVNANPTVSATANPATICVGQNSQLEAVVGGVSSPGTLVVTISNGGWMDEVSWTLTNSLGATIGSGGPYGLGGSNSSTIGSAANGPYIFNLETQGFYNDNVADYVITCNGATVLSGTLTGGLTTSQAVSACLIAPAATYAWTPSATLSNAGIVNPLASPSSNTTYTALVTVAGCQGSGQTTVTVNNPTLATAPANGDMVWKGAASTDWATLGNWWQYNGTAYGAATAAPTAAQNVIIPGNQTCVLNQPNTFANGGNAKSLRIETGANLTMGNGTLSIAENMVNNGTFAPGTGTVEFAGSGNHGISGSSLAHNFNNVTMNKAGEVQLSVPIAISGALTLTNGRLDIGNFNLDLPTNTINGGNANSYVKTSGTGTLSRDVAGIAVNFPVGRSAYNAATLTNAGTADKYSVRVIDNVTDIGTNADAGATTTMAVVNRTWMINEQVNGGSDVTLGLNWNGAPEHIGGFQAPSAFIAHYMSGAGLWDNIGGAVATNTIETSGITSFSPFTISSDLNFAPLPVELMSFSSVCSDNDVAIKWSTASENNSMHFVVETSTDAVNWEVLSVVPAAQFSTSILNYAITHEGAARNKNYYRLKQVDLNGAVEFFNVIYANCGNVAGEPVAFPNPSNGNFTIDFSGAEMKGVVQLSIMNTEGKEISNREVNLEEGVNTYQINNMELQPGIYYLKIVDTTGRSFIIKHSFI